MSTDRIIRMHGCIASGPDADKSRTTCGSDPRHSGRCTGSHTQGEWAERRCRPPGGPGLPETATLLSRLGEKLQVKSWRLDGAPHPSQSRSFQLPLIWAGDAQKRAIQEKTHFEGGYLLLLGDSVLKQHGVESIDAPTQYCEIPKS